MFFNELKLGQRVFLKPVTIEKEKMLSFAEQYANLPIHTDEEYAKGTHFGQLLAPGMFTFLEIWANYLKEDLFGEELLAGKSTSVEWLAPVFAGDTIHSFAQVTALYERNEKNGIAELTITGTNDNFDDVLRAVIRVVVKKS